MTQDDRGLTRSGLLSASKFFSTREFLRTYDSVEISLFTPKVALVPLQFYRRGNERETLSRTVKIALEDSVKAVALPEFGAVLLYSLDIGESLSLAARNSVLTTAGERVEVLPEMFFMLKDLRKIKDYNKIVASYADSCLYLAVAQGGNLLLSNVYEASDFTTAEYFIFLAMKNLQLNPELSSIFFRTELSEDMKLSLYRYFKSVEEF